MSNLKDLIDKQFGKLTVISRAENDKRGLAKWVCKCDCGNIKIVNGRELRNGDTKSCGCLNSFLSRKRATKHRMHGTPEYRIYKNMNNRCYNLNVKGYKYYGGRGIRVCDRWRDSFPNFLKDMGPRPTPQHSINRIDNNGDYCPENCEWATWTEQARNKRSNGSSGVKGVYKVGKKWRSRIMVNGVSINLGMYGDFKNAVKARKEAERKYYS